MNENVVSSDVGLLDLLRIRGSLTVVDLAAAMEVTATAVRQRLNRLMANGYIDRKTLNRGRGRPIHSYDLTSKGRQKTGTNFADLAIVLWEEIRAIEDAEVKRGLIKRLSQRLAEFYADQVTGETVEERMQSIKEIFAERRLPTTIKGSGELPVLSIWACPYPDLAEQDRSICSMEQMMISELLDTNVRLAECRLDGGQCCSFEPSQN